MVSGRRQIRTNQNSCTFVFKLIYSTLHQCKYNYTVTWIFYYQQRAHCKSSYDNLTPGIRLVCHMCLRHLYWYACLNIILHSWCKALSKWHFLHGNSVYWKRQTFLRCVISRHLQPNELCPFSSKHSCLSVRLSEQCCSDAELVKASVRHSSGACLTFITFTFPLPENATVMPLRKHTSLWQRA